MTSGTKDQIIDVTAENLGEITQELHAGKYATVYVLLTDQPNNEKRWAISRWWSPHCGETFVVKIGDQVGVHDVFT